MNVSQAPAKKTWEKTWLQNLWHHRNGRYYARLYLNGKEIWKSLKTSHFSVAEARLAERLKEQRERKGKKIDLSNARMSFGDAATLKMSQSQPRSTSTPVLPKV